MFIDVPEISAAGVLAGRPVPSSVPHVRARTRSANPASGGPEPRNGGAGRAIRANPFRSAADLV
jgi:hypothetical protein